MFDRIETATRSAPTLTRGLTQQIRMSDWRAVMDSTQRQQEEYLRGIRDLPNVGKRLTSTIDMPYKVRLAVLRNRILKKFLTPGPRNRCWEWEGRVEDHGYSRIRWGKRYIGGHRASYMAFIADIPDDLVIDHLCRNRACANPWHLEPVTPTENWRRGISVSAIASRRDTCVHGHEYTPENTFLSVRGGSRPYQYRECRTCRYESQKRYEDRKFGELAQCGGVTRSGIQCARMIRSSNDRCALHLSSNKEGES